MGCWQETDCITQMPIFDGEEVYLIVFDSLCARMGLGEFIGSLTFDVVDGTYDDYGKINEIEKIDQYLDKKQKEFKECWSYAFLKKNTYQEIKKLNNFSEDEYNKIIQRFIYFEKNVNKKYREKLIECNQKNIECLPYEDFINSDEIISRVEKCKIMLDVCRYATLTRINISASNVFSGSQTYDMDYSKHRANLIMQQADQIKKEDDKFYI